MIYAKIIVVLNIAVVIIAWIRFMIPTMKDLTEGDSGFLRFFSNFIMYIPIIAGVLLLGLVVFMPNA